MSYIFIDESGDLGFDFTKPKTSRYFLITDDSRIKRLWLTLGEADLLLLH
jgi:hypothetical protein